ncbi:MAG: hypothetical protein HYY40_00585, partial [Bacteroidetes bacterium]|nr:hypothetical protein [Bacteroidota bacterium]
MPISFPFPTFTANFIPMFTQTSPPSERLNSNIDVLTFALALSFAFSSQSLSQPWINRDNPPQNFFDIQKSFNNYWQGKTVQKGKGWMPYKRWEYFWEPRVGASGKFPDAMVIYMEWLKEKQNSVAKSGMAGNWTSLGPLQVPTYGGAGRINCIRFDPTNSSTIWAGSPSGGLWKSDDGGTTWSTNTDLLPIIGVSDIAIDPT